MAGVITSAGTRVYISTTALSSGYTEETLTGLTYVEIGEITNIPEFGRVYASVSHNAVGNRRTLKRKGSFNDGEVPLTMARVTTDAGQSLLRTAINSDRPYGFMVQTRDDTHYLAAVVSSYTANIGGSDGIVQSTARLDIDELFADVIPPGPNPYFANVVLLMHMNGADNGTVFTDVKGKSVTLFGNTVTKTATKKYGTASAYFDGNGDYLTVPDSADFEFGAGDFTVEFWLNPTAATSGGILSKYDLGGQGWRIYYNANGTLFVTHEGFSASTINAPPGSINFGTFSHVAWVRSGTTIKLYIGGVAVASTTTTNALANTSAPLSIGRWEYSGTTSYMTGHLDDLRITKGVARYTADFIPTKYEFPDA
jgi:hypothetical protein